MNKLRRLEVEPLSEQRWSKLERSLFSRFEHEPSAPIPGPEPSFWRVSARVRVALALASVVAAAALVFVVRALPTAAPLELPSRITTGVSTSHLALAGLSVDVEPQSAVVVGPETSQGQLIVLDRGGIVCDVARRPSDSPLIVQAGAVRVRVLGTRFSVSRVGETARVKVEHGLVEVSSSGRSSRVAAGQEWLGQDELQVSAPNGAVPSAGASAPSRAEVSEPSRAEVSEPPPAQAPRRTAAAPSPPETARAPDLALKAPEPSRQEVFEQAAALERREPARAAKLYAALESGGDSWAQNALYARARLEAARGNHAEARGLLGRYLKRFPRGINAEDARAVLQQLR
jgi:hypothetical protein